jgi:hypothetical protein
VKYCDHAGMVSLLTRVRAGEIPSANESGLYCACMLSGEVSDT